MISDEVDTEIGNGVIVGVSRDYRVVNATLYFVGHDYLAGGGKSSSGKQNKGLIAAQSSVRIDRGKIDLVAWLEVSDYVAVGGRGRSKDKSIVVGSSVQGIDAGSSVQVIVAGVAVDRVAVVSAIDVIVAVAAVDRIGAIQSEHCFDPLAPEEPPFRVLLLLPLVPRTTA